MLVAAWLFLALVHLTPAAVLVRPDLIRSLYAVEAAGDLGVLLISFVEPFSRPSSSCVYTLPGSQALGVLLRLLLQSA